MSQLRPAAFAIPGDITSLSGGYIYERRLLEELRAQGRDVLHLELPRAFPTPRPPRWPRRSRPSWRCRPCAP